MGGNLNIHQSGLTRRSALKSGSVALLAAAGGAWPAISATPNRGGVLRMGMADGATTDVLNPAITPSTSGLQTFHCVHNFLAEIDNNNQIVPELAESWTPSSDARRWAFKLKPGLTFHNGKSVTAHDVIATLRYHQDVANGSGGRPLLSAITDTEIEDPLTFAITLQAGNVDFPAIMTDYHFGILPADADGSVDVSGVGCGPYELEVFEPGVRTYFRKFQDYHKSDRGHFDRIELNVIPDSAARINALVTGEVDVIDSIETKAVSRLASVDGVIVHSVTGEMHMTFPMLSNRPPFDNVELRRALKFGINRDAMVKTILGGHGAVGNDHPLSPAHKYFAPDVEQTPYDPDRARFHLKNAGLTEFSIELNASEAAFTGAVDTAILYREHAAKAAIDITVKRHPVDGYWSDVWLKTPLCMSYWGGRPTADMILSTCYQSGADWNEARFSNDRFDDLLLRARSELDEAKRASMYGEIQQILRDDGGSVIPMFAAYLFAHRDNVQSDSKLANNRRLDGFRGVERWWMA